MIIEVNQSIFNEIKSSKIPIHRDPFALQLVKKNGKFRIFLKKNQILHYAISVSWEKVKLKKKQEQKRKIGFIGFREKSVAK